MIPLPYKLGGIVLAVMSIFCIGAYEGYSHEHAKFEEYQKQVAIVAEVQKQKVEQEKKQDEQISNNVVNGYRNALDSLHNFYTSSSGVSSVSKATEGANGNPTYSVLAQECATTTLQLTYLQKWVNEQYKEDQ